MKVILDTNIIIDVLLAREPFYHSAVQLFSEVLVGNVVGYLAATTITTVDYLLSKALTQAKAKVEIKKLLQIFEIAPITHGVLESALSLSFKDYEDAVIHQAGNMIGAEVIITRDRVGFSKASLSVYAPDEFLTLLRANKA